MRMFDAVLGAVGAEESAGVCHCGRDDDGDGVFGWSYDAAFLILLIRRKSV